MFLVHGFLLVLLILGGGQKRKHHCTMKNSNPIIHTVYRSIQAGIKAIFKLKHTPIRHNIMTREATIPFFQNRSNTANSEDRPIPIQYDTSAVFFFLCNLEFLYFTVLT